MADHTRALVPIEAWCYASPDIRASSGTVDIGLFAESLLYYEQILLNVGNGSQLGELLAWLTAHSTLADFLALSRHVRPLPNERRRISAGRWTSSMTCC